MTKLVLEATAEGLIISADVLEKAGVQPGRMVEVELAQLPGAEEIQIRALGYSVKHLGNAILVGPAYWREGQWMVDLRSPDNGIHLGYLYLDAHGAILEEKSATYHSIRETFHAAGSPGKAA